MFGDDPCYLHLSFRHLGGDAMTDFEQHQAKFEERRFWAGFPRSTGQSSKRKSPGLLTDGA
jgi:hypothetical protein